MTINSISRKPYTISHKTLKIHKENEIEDWNFLCLVELRIDNMETSNQSEESSNCLAERIIMIIIEVTAYHCAYVVYYYRLSIVWIQKTIL